MKELAITIAFVSIFLILTGIPTSESVLWDLIVSANMEKNPIEFGEIPIITGTVLDHASDPIENVQVSVRFSTNVVTAITNSTGHFQYEFKQPPEPGRYIVNIMAKNDEGKIGLSSFSFRVLGTVAINTENIFGTYTTGIVPSKTSSEEELKKDPIAYKIYLYNLEFKKKISEIHEAQSESIKHKKFVDEQRILAAEAVFNDTSKKHPGYGIYTGYKLKNFLGQFDNSIKTIFGTQLNYTLQKFSDARNAMSQVLENGGTMQEARQAYFEYASMSRNEIESLTQTLQENESPSIKELIQNATTNQITENKTKN